MPRRTKQSAASCCCYTAAAWLAPEVQLHSAFGLQSLSLLSLFLSLWYLSVKDLQRYKDTVQHDMNMHPLDIPSVRLVKMHGPHDSLGS
jgi:hypothetical protein